VKVFDVVDGEAQKTGGGHTLKGLVTPRTRPRSFDRTGIRHIIRHTGPVWQISWAHPKYGHILASCSYDGKVLIWKEQQTQGSAAGVWTKVKEHTLHTASGKKYFSSVRNAY